MNYVSYILSHAKKKLVGWVFRGEFNTNGLSCFCFNNVSQPTDKGTLLMLISILRQPLK